MRNRLAFRFSVEGDARFLSHHDMMRLMERAAARAGLPLKFSQGFNPRPRISLPLPRPVGVAARDDVLLLELETPIDPRDAHTALAGQLPEGITATECLVADTQDFHAVQVDYELPLEAGMAQAAVERLGEELGEKLGSERLVEKLGELAGQPQWPWIRRTGKDEPPREIDLRPLIAAIACEGGVLKWTLQPAGQQWARVEEVLGLLGLDEQGDRARTVRAAIRWQSST